MKPLNHSFQNRLPLSRNRDPNLSQNEHVHAICCRPEAYGDVISGKNVKTTLKFEDAVFEVVSEISKQEGPPIGGAGRNALSLIPQRLLHIILAITCSENVHALPCIDSHGRVDCHNNMTTVGYVMHRST